MHIEDYIPFGYAKRITRESLEVLTGCNDRTNRAKITEALLERNILIVNIDNGYFRPDGSLGDEAKARMYYYQEKSRTSSCDKRSKAILECLKPQKQDDLTSNQMDLKMFGIG